MDLINKVGDGVQGVRDHLESELQENVTDVFTGEGQAMAGRHGEELEQLMPKDEWEKVLETREKDVVWTYCLIFPVEGEEAMEGIKGKTLGKAKAKLNKNYGKTEDDMTIEREKVLDALRGAGFKLRLFHATNKKEKKIICKVGATDARFLEVAEANDYLLRLSEVSTKKVLETEEVLANGEKRLPIYLDYPYNDPDLKAKLLPNFKSIGGLGTSRLTMSQIKKKIHEQTKLNPFQWLHLPYDDKVEERIVQNHGVQIYKQYGGGILRTYDRIKLTQMSIESPKVAIKGNKGAGLNLKKLQFDGVLLAAYPVSFNETVHRDKELTVDQLYDKWHTTFHKPWRQPIDDIRDYAGEKIALYFSFLGFYTAWLFPAAFVGLFVFCLQLYALNDQAGTFNFITGSTDVIIRVNPATGDQFLVPVRPTEIAILPWYALFIALWGTFLLEFWKRRQSSLALKWGTSDYERAAVVRPEFTPTYVLPDVVTGLPELYRSPVVFGVKLAASFGTVVMFVVAVIAAIWGTLVFKDFMSTSGLPESVAPQIALVVNAVLIIILGQVFKLVAKLLTNWENHRTDIEFEDSLIAKTFLFSFFNSYSTLMYYAFIKSGAQIRPEGAVQFCIAQIQELSNELTATGSGNFTLEQLQEADSCYGAVGYSLFILFGVQIFVSNSVEVGVPLATQLWKAYKARTKKSIEDAKNAVVDAANVVMRDQNEEKDEEPEDEDIDRSLLVSPAEQQFLLLEYESPFDDYLEIALQFGYVTLFVSAFPLAPFFALIACYVEFRVDSAKICFLARKPDLSSAQDIGQWLTIFTILSFVSVLVNSGLLLFTVKESIITDAAPDAAIRVWYFVVFVGLVYSIKLVADYFIVDVPIQVKLQLERQEHIKRKVFDQEPDDDGLDLEGGEKEDGEQHKEREDEEYLKNATPVESFDPLINYMIESTRAVLREQNPEIQDLIKLSDSLFKEADTNNDKELSLKELKDYLRSPKYNAPLASMSKFEIGILMNAMDVNGDGAISQKEFDRFMFGKAIIRDAEP